MHTHKLLPIKKWLRLLPLMILRTSNLSKMNEKFKLKLCIRGHNTRNT